MAPSMMASGRHNTVLLLVVVATLPVTTLLLWFNYAAVVLAAQRSRLSLRKQKATWPKTALITGTGTAFGLNLARALNEEGYRVVGADVVVRDSLSIAKRSRAISKHYSLPVSAIQNAEYIARRILVVVKREGVGLWIDCSQNLPLRTIATTRTELQEKGACACIAADATSIQQLENREAFLDFLRERSLPAPEVHQVRSRSDIHNVLNHSQGKKQYMLTSPARAKPFDSSTLLPRRSLSQTYHEVSLVKVNANSPMLLQEYADPARTYECFAIVVQGVVRFFGAGQNAEFAGGNVHQDSALWQAMRAYTDAIARELGQGFSSHLTLTFGVIERVSQAGVESKLLPLKGAYQPNPAFVLPVGKSSDLVQAYVSVSQLATNGKSSLAIRETTMTTPSTTHKHLTRQRYFLLEDIANLFIDPCIGFLRRRTSLGQVLTSIVTMLHRLLFWDEAYYDFWDPVPAFWQYSVVFAWTALFASSPCKLARSTSESCRGSYQA
ncbi:hypothetical protein LTR70_000249 [Exophiala xenobiotica]|uniref:Uncharacterized protein n=1 Tax=Lithohypha guttulata TaxID=1690604 RepID=A0ABR0K518_9EURO|nr:hypothetical protein LTR24_007043 [Lithohypha guttulata]KAK5330927.1 hypothetical protein LTR70_000249 [Exophiala xenobiotica]